MTPQQKGNKKGLGTANEVGAATKKGGVSPGAKKTNRKPRGRGRTDHSIGETKGKREGGKSSPWGVKCTCNHQEKGSIVGGDFRPLWYEIQDTAAGSAWASTVRKKRRVGGEKKKTG